MQVMFIIPSSPHGDAPLDSQRECYIHPLPALSTMATLPSNALEPSRSPLHWFLYHQSLPPYITITQTPAPGFMRLPKQEVARHLWPAG